MKNSTIILNLVFKILTLKFNENILLELVLDVNNFLLVIICIITFIIIYIVIWFILIYYVNLLKV